MRRLLSARNKNAAKTSESSILVICTEKSKKLISEFQDCETIENKKEKDKRKREVKIKIKTLLAHVVELGEPGSKLRELIELFLSENKFPDGLVGKLIHKREGVFVVSKHPIRNPKKSQDENNSVVRNIIIRDMQTITAPSTIIKPPSPRDRRLEELKVSKHKLPRIKEEKYRIK